ncbi:MAG: ATP-binding protein [Deltaproteobacteria bacterium]|nr:ATP-binding protein [Deltaproteobacteria bacterium]
MARIELSTEMENLGEILDFVDKEAGKAGFSTRRMSEIRLAAEEALVNIFSYAYPKKNGRVSVSCFLREDRFVLELLDSGIPFNIMAASEPDVSSNLSERDVGGLGIYFIKEMTTETKYVRDKEQNRLTLVFARYRGKSTERN